MPATTHRLAKLSRQTVADFTCLNRQTAAVSDEISGYPDEMPFGGS